ncbi:MAG: GxxExxY protein [Candidatus Marinimicrobia bacterium]|nr:GxxExxY protein [Candidatus Neomarinimicrobiota bacterium]
MTKDEINKLSEKVIGCCIEVHKRLGPGLLESVYEKALCIELKRNGIPFERQKTLHVTYRGESVGTFRLDILVKEIIVLELKSVERHDPVFEATILSYLKLGKYPLGLLINFNSKLLKNGIKRFVNNF